MRRNAPSLRPFGRRVALAFVFALLGLASAEARAAGSGQSKPKGRPEVTLDRLTFSDPVLAREFERHLKQSLRREARRADWGAGSGSKIEFRFVVEELSASVQGSVLRIRCTAFGRLPKGKSARSRIEYGGSPARRSQEIKKVLEIVARGVITRLAELERRRRSSGQ